MKTVDGILREMSGLAKEIRGNSISNAYELLMGYAERIEAAVKTLKADRDNWRRQALDEDARANATCKESLQVGNAAKCKELLGEVYALLDKSKSYSNYIESIDRKREFSRYLTKAKNLVDNIINQELSANVIGNAAEMREALLKILGIVDHLQTRYPLLPLVFSEISELGKIAEVALAEPPRNCDRFNIGEALCKYGFPTKSKPWGEKEWLDFCEWYISEAKVGVK